MNVIGHEAIAEDFYAVAAALVGEKFEILPAIVIDEENVLAIVAALGEVVGKIGDDNASDARHGRGIMRRKMEWGKEIGDCP